MSAPHDERLALGCALAAVLAWSTVATGFKLGLRVLEPLQLLWLGALISLAFFAATLLASGRWRALLRLGAHDWAWVAGLGLLNPFLYYFILFEAYDRLPAQIAQPLNYTWAIMLALLAVPILGQALTRRTLAGIVVSYAGVVVLLAQGRLDGFAQVDLLGVVLALFSTLVWALYWLANVRLKIDALVLMTGSFAVGAPAIGLACARLEGLPALSAPALGYGAWVGLVEMGVTFVLWQTAMRRTAHAGRIAQLIFLSPFLSLVLIDRVLGEAVSASSVAGLALIVAGLLIARR
jgi:drug/metabolite transporter (DMT)-like permease